MFNPAQKLLLDIGVDPWVLLFASWRHRSRSFTKKGPGRLHKQGKRGA